MKRRRRHPDDPNDEDDPKLRRRVVAAAVSWYEKIIRDYSASYGKNSLDQDLVAAIEAYLYDE